MNKKVGFGVVMPAKALKDFLDLHKIKYLCIAHKRVVTAQEIAASAHISGKQLAKIVIVKINNQLAMVVLPASDKVDFPSLQKMTSAESAQLACESEFQHQFPECELGAMPPFGNLYGMSVYVSNQLGEFEKLTFSAGSHSELMQVAYQDFEKLVNPTHLKS